MFNVELFTEEFFAWYVGVGIERMVTIILQLFIQFVANNIVAAYVQKTKFVLQQFDVFIV